MQITEDFKIKILKLGGSHYYEVTFQKNDFEGLGIVYSEIQMINNLF